MCETNCLSCAPRRGSQCPATDLRFSASGNFAHHNNLVPRADCATLTASPKSPKVSAPVGASRKRPRFDTTYPAACIATNRRQNLAYSRKRYCTPDSPKTGFPVFIFLMRLKRTPMTSLTDPDFERMKSR